MIDIIVAAPGWRIVLADNENGGALVLPIVAWERLAGHRPSPILTPYFNHPYAGSLVSTPDNDDLFVEYLAPGQEPDEAMYERADDVLRAYQSEPA